MPTLDELFAAVQQLDMDAQDRIRDGLTRLMEMVSQSAKGLLLEKIHKRWPEHEDDILMALRPVVLIDLDRSGSRPGRGASKVGGVPDLPADCAWPRDEAGRPLSFVAQINMAGGQEFATNLSLPLDGLLSLFCTRETDDLKTGRPESAVLFHKGADLSLVSVEAPDDLDEEEGIFARKPLELEQGFALAPGKLPAGIAAGVDRLLSHGQGTLLGHPEFRRPELQAAFNPVTDELLLSLNTFDVVCLPGSPDSVYQDGSFYLTIDRGDLVSGALDRATLLYDGLA